MAAGTGVPAKAVTGQGDRGRAGGPGLLWWLRLKVAMTDDPRWREGGYFRTGSLNGLAARTHT